MTVPVAKLHRSRRLSLDQLALVEMLTIGGTPCAATARSGENVLVIGAGPIGLATTRLRRCPGRGSASSRSAPGVASFVGSI